MTGDVDGVDLEPEFPGHLRAPLPLHHLELERPPGGRPDTGPNRIHRPGRELGVVSLLEPVGEILARRKVGQPIVLRPQGGPGVLDAPLRVPIRHRSHHHPPQVGAEAKGGIVMKPLRPLPVADEDILGDIGGVRRLEAMGAAPAEDRSGVEIDKLGPRLRIVGRFTEPIEEAKVRVGDVRHATLEIVRLSHSEEGENIPIDFGLKKGLR